MGIFDRIFASLAAEGPKAQRIMINSTRLKAHRSRCRHRPESMRPEPGAYFTAVGEAELRRGLAILPAGRRRTALDAATDSVLDEVFCDHVLPFNRESVGAQAVIASGRPASQFDFQIGAIARACGARVATRNTGDYAGCGVALIDPLNRTKGH